MQTPGSRRSPEQGAVLIQVAVCLLGLLAFSAFVVDYGVMWASRGQAQTSADAGAHAGAVSLAFDSAADLSQAKDAARTKAQATALQNSVWGQPPDVTPSDVTFPACPPGAPGLPDTCVKVDAFRNQRTGGKALPVFFASLIGVSSQGVVATATAQVATANAVDCLRPFAVPDKWKEHWEGTTASEEPWTPEKTFDGYTRQGDRDDLVATPDDYLRPTADTPGTGFTPFDGSGKKTADYGLQLTLKGDASELASGWYQLLDLPGYSGGTEDVRNSIANCIPRVWTIGEDIYTKPGGSNGIKFGVDDLVAKDKFAEWDEKTKSIVKSCAPGPCPGPGGEYYAQSPRIVPVPLFDVETFITNKKSVGKAPVPITNIAGFFVECPDPTDCSENGRAIVGRLVSTPGLKKGTGGVHATGSFLRTVLLVR